MTAARVVSDEVAPAVPGVVVLRFREVYGNVLCYPGCLNAVRIAAIAKTKTLSPQVVKLAQGLGFEVRLDDQSPAVLERFLGGRS